MKDNIKVIYRKNDGRISKSQEVEDTSPITDELDFVVANRKVVEFMRPEFVRNKKLVPNFKHLRPKVEPVIRRNAGKDMKGNLKVLYRKNDGFITGTLEVGDTTKIADDMDFVIMKKGVFYKIHPLYVNDGKVVAQFRL